TGYLNDSWALSLSGTPTWSQLAPSGGPPGARAFHAAVYDRARQRMLVFAGTADFQASLDYNDVWALSLSGDPQWTFLSTASRRPAARETPAMIYDPVRDRIVIFAGVGNGGYLRDLWTLPLAGNLIWAPLVANGGPPCARWAHS